MAGVKGMTGLLLGFLLLAEFLQEQVGAGAGEGVRWKLGFDGRLEVVVLGVESTKEIQNLARLRDGKAEVAQPVGESFELGAVVIDAYLALLQGAELGFQDDGTLHLIVAEEVLDGAPDGVRRGLRIRRCRRRPWQWWCRL